MSTKLFSSMFNRFGNVISGDTANLCTTVIATNIFLLDIFGCECFGKHYGGKLYHTHVITEIGFLRKSFLLFNRFCSCSKQTEIYFIGTSAKPLNIVVLKDFCIGISCYRTTKTVRYPSVGFSLFLICFYGFRDRYIWILLFGYSLGFKVFPSFDKFCPCFIIPFGSIHSSYLRM